MAHFPDLEKDEIPFLPTGTRADVGDAIDAMILVVNVNEWQAALRFCNLTLVVQHGVTQYFYGTMRESNLRVVLLRQPEQGSLGYHKTQALMTTALEVWSPRIVLAVGVAFGICSKNQDACDVLVSKIILPYEWAAERANKSENRNRPAAVDPDLFNLFEQAQDANPWQLYNASNKMCNLYCGGILCGEKLVDNEAKKKVLLELVGATKKKDMEGFGMYTKDNVLVVGGEMEGFGMYSACQRDKFPCIVVKGISDFGEQKASQGKELNQKRAAYAAFSLVSHVLHHRKANIPTRTGQPRIGQPKLSTKELVIKPCSEGYELCCAAVEATKAANGARHTMEIAVSTEDREELQRVKEELRSLESRRKLLKTKLSKLSPGNIDATLEQEEDSTKAELIDKWPFTTSNVSVQDDNGRPIATLDLHVTKSRIPWSGELLRTFLPEARAIELEEAIRPCPTKSLDVELAPSAEDPGSNSKPRSQRKSTTTKAEEKDARIKRKSPPNQQATTRRQSKRKNENIK
eukprot:TRINITY_DN1499_c0_g1_i2.p1 TRINITY_DN1499_c0_g1~~TRINITY_DN1499_c0_g1_i2.p1  ORF type:complete len:518 (+),score=64.38 TRINITY_DN1499_c0_g1_i2:202-1755(+)